MKSYICKDCKHNNNGWCNARSFQHKKEVTGCADYYSTEYTKINELSKEEAYVVLFALNQATILGDNANIERALKNRLELYLTTEEDI